MVKLSTHDSSQIKVEAEIEDLYLLESVDSFRYKVVGNKVFGFILFNLDVLRQIFTLFDNVELSDTLSEVIHNISKSLTILEKIKKSNIDRLDLKLKTELLPHQVKPLYYISTLNKAGLFLDMGLGKTKLALDWLFIKKDKWTKAMIVTPKSVIGHWMDEIKLHSDFSAKYVKAVKDGYPKDVDLIVVNYEKVLRLGVPDWINAIILDESFMIKNNSKTTRLLIKQTGHIKLKLLLSGPISEGYKDYFYQMYFLSPAILGVRSMTEFKNKFCIMGGFKLKQIVGYKNVETLMNRMNPVTYVMKRNEVKGFRKAIKMKKFVSIKSYPDILKAYNEIKRELATILESGDAVRIKSAASKIMKLLQLPSGFVYLDNEDGTKIKTHFFKRSPKLEVLKEILEEISSENRVLVWFKYKGERELFEKSFKDTLIIDGTSSVEQRAKFIKEYKEGRNLIFVQIDSSKYGVEIPADYVVYFSNSFSYITRKQSEARSLRVTTKKDVIYIDIESEPDKRIRQILELKDRYNKRFSDFMLSEASIDADFIRMFVEDML